MLHGFIPHNRFLPYLSWTEIAALPDRADTVIVLPVGAIEQHGPHLPCAVDAVVAAGVVGHALAKLPSDVPAYALAPICYGKSDEHLDFPGTMTLTAPTLLATILEIGESVYRSGFRKFLLVNSHGGQPQVMEVAARELRIRHADYIIVPGSVWRVPHAAGRFLAEREKKLAMHAGHAETAVMLALAPETVRMDRAVASYPPAFPSKVLSPDGRPACAWVAKDLSANGTIGDPCGATVEQGKVIVESLAESWTAAIIDLHKLRWPEPTAASIG